MIEYGKKRRPTTDNDERKGKRRKNAKQTEKSIIYSLSVNIVPVWSFCNIVPISISCVWKEFQPEKLRGNTSTA